MELNTHNLKGNTPSWNHCYYVESRYGFDLFDTSYDHRRVPPYWMDSVNYLNTFKHFTLELHCKRFAPRFIIFRYVTLL